MRRWPKRFRRECCFLSRVSLARDNCHYLFNISSSFFFFLFFISAGLNLHLVLRSIARGLQRPFCARLFLGVTKGLFWRSSQRKPEFPNGKSIFFKPSPSVRAGFLDFLSIQGCLEFQNGQESGLQGDAEVEARFVLCWAGGGRGRNEWHAARLASLKTSHTVTWEEFKKKQKEDELKRDELEADKDRMMREYRAQLDAERARKLSLGRNHSASKSHHKKDRKSKESKKRSSRKRKHKRSSESSSSGSSSESSSSDDDYDNNDDRESRRSRSKRSKKKRKHRSRAKHSSSSCSDSEESDGPVRLSKFFGVAVAKR